MKNKELKQLAQKIAKYEKIIASSSDEQKVKEAKVEIMKLSSSLSWQDLDLLDEMIQEILKNS